MDSPDTGVTISGEFYRWGKVVESGCGELIVFYEPNSELFTGLSTSVENIVSQSAERNGLELFREARALREIIYEKATGDYTGLDIGELFITDEGHLYRSIVITSSKGITIEAVLSNSSGRLCMTLHRIERFADRLEINPRYIKLTFRGQESPKGKMQEILSMGMILHGEPVDIQTVLFKDMTDSQIIREYFETMCGQLKGLVIDEEGKTVTVDDEVLDWEVVLGVARYHIRELYLGKFFDKLPYRSKTLSRSDAGLQA